MLCNQPSHSGTGSFLYTFNHLDYIIKIAQEHSYCLAIENFLILKFQNILFFLITSILNHFLHVGCSAMDVGAMTSFL